MAIGDLPMTLRVDGKDYEINSDYRDILDIFEMLSLPSLSNTAKVLNMIDGIFYPNNPKNKKEAQEKAVWFMDIGGACGLQEKQGSNKKTIDYKQDEQILFSAVNAVVGYDVRSLDYMHWWTFYGICQSISPESLMAHITNIRHKKNKGIKLEKYEERFYSDNRHLIDFKIDEEEYNHVMKFLRGE